MRSITIRPIVFLIFIITAVCGGATFEVQPGQRQLFIDDLGVAKIENLERNIHQPAKKGTVLRPIAPDSTSLQTRTAPVWDPQEKIFKFWVSGSKDPYRTSPDGLHWKSGSDPESHSHPSMAVRDPKDPDPTRRYKAALLNSGFAVSPDGIHWTKLDLPAISSSDEGNFSYNPKEGLFIHTVKRGGPYGRSVAAATSTDFQNWTDHGLIFHADELDQEMGVERIEARRKNPYLKQTEYNNPAHYSVQIYNMGVFQYEGVFIGLPSMYHHTGKVPPSWPGFEKLNLSPYIQECVDKYGDYTGFYTVQLISSRDMKNWNRLGDRQPFLAPSMLGSGAYDLQTIIGPSEPVDRGDELWFYYTGIKAYAFISAGEIPGYDDYVGNKGAVNLAVLRKDGFISLDADHEEGTVLTKPFELAGKKLLVNFAGRKHSHLRAEILDASDKVLANSAPLTGNHMSGKIEWVEGDPAVLAGQQVKLRFSLVNGSFYSYWFE